MDELHYITESAPLTPEQFDYILNWGRKRTMKSQRDTRYLAFAEKLIEALPENRDEWKVIVAQHVYDLATPEEYIDSATHVRMLVEHDNPEHPKVTIACPSGHQLTFEQVNEAVKRLSKLAFLPPTEETYTLTCTSCNNAVRLTEQQALIWDGGMSAIEGTAYCKVCGGEVKLSTNVSTSPERQI